MKIIDLTKDSFVEKVADYQLILTTGTSKGINLAWSIFRLRGAVYCKALSPILDQLAKEYEGKLDIYKVDVDQEPELESAFKIRTIPNLLLCPLNGKPTMKLGTMNKKSIERTDRNQVYFQNKNTLKVQGNF